MTPQERFLARVDRTESCWLWLLACDSSGYGTYWDPATRKTTAAHRYAYRLLVGHIPAGYEVDHLCFTPRCVRPDHMEAVTGAENLRRKYARVTHCANGHPFDEQNTYLRGGSNGGQRGCRACNAQAAQRYKARRVGAA